MCGYVSFMFLQFEYTKPTRNKYNITSQHIQMLSTLYYIHTSSPSRRGIKQLIRYLMKSHQSEYIFKLLDKLSSVGLVVYDNRSATDYTIKLSEEGVYLCKELFDEDNIDRFMDNKLNKVF